MPGFFCIPPKKALKFGFKSPCQFTKENRVTVSRVWVSHALSF